MIRVLIADDHPVTRDALRMYLEDAQDIRVISEATHGLDAVQQAKDLNPDVIFMDVSMPGESGIEATRQIVRENPDAKVIVLSALETARHAIEALQAGAKGYFSKQATSTEIVSAVREADDDALLFSSDMARKLFVEVRTTMEEREELLATVLPAPEIPPGELAVLKKLAQGMTNTRIAKDLFLSVGTVKTYVYRLRERLDTEDRLSTVIRAFELGLIEPPPTNSHA